MNNCQRHPPDGGGGIVAAEDMAWQYPCTCGPYKPRQLISSDEAVPATEQHERACSDCPWARMSLRGWLGALSADEWLQEAHGEADIQCHVLTGVQCAGAAIYRANMGKLPRNPNLMRLPTDRVAVFANPREFKEHHER